jgi:hypothetical protein
MAIHCLIFGRIWPMVLAHYLHNALQFVFVVLVAMRRCGSRRNMDDSSQPGIALTIGPTRIRDS